MLRAKRVQQEGKPKLEPVEQAAEVVADGGEHGVDGIAGGMRQKVAAQTVVALHGTGSTAARRRISRLIAVMRRSGQTRRL